MAKASRQMGFPFEEREDITCTLCSSQYIAFLRIAHVLLKDKAAANADKQAQVLQFDSSRLSGMD